MSLFIFLVTALIGPIFTTKTVSAQVFFVYFFAQTILYGVAWLLQRRNQYFLLGAAIGIGVTTATEAIWELCIYQGSNSMPMFPYIFMAVPAMFVGLFIASLGLDSEALENHNGSFITAFLFTTPFAWYYVYLAIIS